ncbi:40S ribosomal protein S12 [Sarcoptes scabiei]|nr:40S ribosomal protein S12 [Sarcoptes scabiei]
MVEPGLDLNSALQMVLKTSLAHDGLVKGLRQSIKALDSLVEALCARHTISLIKVDDNKKLGEWAGMCKIDKEGKARKVVGCSCVVVKNWVEETPGLNFLKQYLGIKSEEA